MTTPFPKLTRDQQDAVIGLQALFMAWAIARVTIMAWFAMILLGNLSARTGWPCALGFTTTLIIAGIIWCVGRVLGIKR